MDSATLNVIRWVRELQTRRMPEGQKEYKTSIILAVLGILAANPEHPNRFEYRELLPIFKSLVSAQDENSVTFQERQFSNPYLRLRTDNYPIQIWLPQPIEGALEKGETGEKAGNPSYVRRNYPFAKINESVWSAFTSKESRVLILKEINERFNPSVIQTSLFDALESEYKEGDLNTDISSALNEAQENQIVTNLAYNSDDFLSTGSDSISEENEPENQEYTLKQCADYTNLVEDTLRQWVEAIKSKGQAILYGPPGTGKTFVAEHLAKHLVGGGNGLCDLVQFHPAYTYEDFIQGIRPAAGKDGGLIYSLIDGRFLNFCKKAQKREGDSVLIIDEINRANLSQVFGELMYLLEYRGKDIPLAGGSRFQIPEKVLIIGTMNTADRSIALVDYALRRRFAFISLHPDYTLLSKYFKDRNLGFSLEKLIFILKQINQEINDKNYELGVSFFLKKNMSFSSLEIIWKTEIEPYLNEYFFKQNTKVKQFAWDEIFNQLL